MGLADLFGGGSCLGVDVGSAGVKVIQCKAAKKPLAVSACVLQPVGEELNSGVFKNTIEKKKLSSVPSAFSIADEKVENHDFSLPKLENKELATAIDWEVKKAVTSPEFAFHDVVTYPGEAGVDVQCIVASKDVVQGRYDEAKRFGFEPKFLETESSALLSVLKLAKDQAELNKVAIVDLGYSAYRIILVHKNRVSFTRSLYLGLGPICQAIMEEGGLDQVKMLALLKTLSHETPVDPAPMLPVLERQMQESLYTLCEEFRRSEFFAKEQKSLEEVEEVYICGGGGCIPYTVQYIQNHLTEKKVFALDPFQWVKKLPDGIDAASGPMWACAVGLSLRDIL